MNSTIDVLSAGSLTQSKPRFPFIGFFQKRWVYHCLFWLLYFLYVAMVFFSLYEIHELNFYFQLLSFFVINIPMVYFNFYVLIPRFLSTRKYFLYGLFLLVTLLVCGTLSAVIKEIYAHFGFKIFTIVAQSAFITLTGSILEEFNMIMLTTAIKLAKDWIQNQQLLKEREKQCLEAELNFLKSQIQPHFFFNTLNNLYSLTLKKSDFAPEVVLKLSDLMSYMLYESNAHYVFLTKEIAYLQSYLELEKLRVGHRLDLEFDTHGSTEGIKIPPMILILFIENAFKHGVKNNLNHIKMEISLKIDQGFLFFQVKNPVVEQYGSQGNVGIGLGNVKRRLDLLFGNNYALDLTNKERQYTASLKIPVC
jgi:two-component system, LytTR family, sensor kinase